ncbi:hypothetical protein [Bradyrhizobium oligotrophicum]|uniref:hypothetical protein n=1 Tax=Bradyrhizobium oligotrophicum TaxID=44255 RepID=UPI003EBC3D79
MLVGVDHRRSSPRPVIISRAMYQASWKTEHDILRGPASCTWQRVEPIVAATSLAPSRWIGLPVLVIAPGALAVLALASWQV